MSFSIKKSLTAAKKKLKKKKKTLLKQNYNEMSMKYHYFILFNLKTFL